jgi:hypothetical protein
MAGFPEYDQYDALGLAELVKKGEVAPEHLCVREGQIKKDFCRSDFLARGSIPVSS